MQNDEEHKNGERHSENDSREQLREIMGLGDHSFRKSYYPELQKKIAELEYEKNRYKSIFSDALNGIFQAESDGGIIVANPAMVALCGYPSMEQFLAISDIGMQLFAKPEEKDKLVQNIFEKQSLIGFETQFKKYDGTIVDVSLNASVKISSACKYLECFVQDITERKLAEAELLKKDFIIRSASTPIATADLDGKLTYANPVFLETWQFERQEEVLGRLLPEFWMVNDIIEEIMESLIGEPKKWRGEVRAIKKDGTLFDVLVSAATVMNNKGKPVAFMATSIDITEKLRMEEMMVQSEKMLSVGGLAAGMAHEINNPLAGMLQTANVMANRLGKEIHMPANVKAASEAGTTMDSISAFMANRGILRMIDTINESGQRMANTVDNMLTFARKSDSGNSFCNLNTLLDKTLEIAATDYDLKKQYDFKSIKIEKKYGKNLPVVLCEGTKIQQVLLNIFRNGAYAMQESGIESPCFLISTGFIIENSMVVIEIEDNGHGMDETTRKRIFEPFFTTKPVGEGTGLGLSVSYFIITENHGGEIFVDSQPGKGAKFTIRLPVEKIGDD